MASQEHLDILKQGVGVWNQWRWEHLEDIQPDFSGANLQGANLQGANLQGANLREARLVEANLSRALQWHFVGGRVLSSQFGVCFRS